MSTTVDNHAVASFEDVAGPVTTGTNNQGRDQATGASDLLGGSLTGTAAGFANTGFGAFSGLGAGQDEHLQKTSPSTATAGRFTETVVLASSGSNASGYSGVPTAETPNVTGTTTDRAAARRVERDGQRRGQGRDRQHRG